MANKINYDSIEIQGIDKRDYPDFCDAHVIYAEYKNGQVLTDEEMEEINAGELILEDLTKYIF